jgi:acyl carrier protein
MSKFEQMLKILAEYKDFKEGEVTNETSFADLGLDSLDVADLAMRIEEEFPGATIPLDGSVKTIGGVVEIVEKV